MFRFTAFTALALALTQTPTLAQEVWSITENGIEVQLGSTVRRQAVKWEGTWTFLDVITLPNGNKVMTAAAKMTAPVTGKTQNYQVRVNLFHVGGDNYEVFAARTDNTCLYSSVLNGDQIQLRTRACPEELTVTSFEGRITQRQLVINPDPAGEKKDKVDLSEPEVGGKPDKPR